MHTLLDLRGNLSVSVYLTEASVHDVKALDYFYIESSAIYLMDKGYIDFYRLFHLIHEKNAFFVTRAKDNMRFDITAYLQIWIAVCKYLLLALTKKKMHMNQSLHTISKNVGLFLTDKTPINELFNKTVPEKESTDYYMPSLFGPEDF